ncbi:unnamed protein product [Ranitomeya imitator]|uniref:Calpain catalytic domain-containing protein n=1 Tax=Ranitomeya imitator TaxID=111125 RepID=A0ABN9L007_9NEOB|nr:unnamed protein product [Ranitomeya imitator]
MADVTTYMVSCSMCYMFTDRPEEESNFTCQKCRLVALLEEKVRGLEERIATLKLIKENEDFLDRTEASLLVTEGEKSVREPPKADEWKHVTKRSKKTMEKSPTTQLKNRYQIFVEDEDGTPKNEAIPASKKEKGTQQQVTAKSTAKKQRRVVVVGDSLLRGTEAAICRPDITAREVCCLPGAMIKDVTDRIPKLFSSKDVHPFLLIHVGTNDTARKDLPTICKDFEELGKKVKELDAQRRTTPQQTWETHIRQKTRYTHQEGVKLEEEGTGRKTLDSNKDDPGKHTLKGGKNISKTIHSEEIGTKQNPLNCMLANARSLTNKMEELEAEISTAYFDLKDLAVFCNSDQCPFMSDSIATGSVPQDWRIANVVPIFKKGSKSEPGNYRPDMEPPAKRLKPTVSLDYNLVSQAPASSSSPLFEDITFPQDKALQNERIKWKRPKEICECPRFIVDGATRMDVCQGNLSNCWFLSAVACLSLYPQLLEQVVPIDQDFWNGYNGKFRFQFWQYGRWVEIVVDDLLPTVPVQNNGKTQYDLLFVHSKDKDEFWSSLLEKAYAKLKGGYSTLEMGFAGEALEDMTGGVVQSCDTSGPTSDLWSHLHNMLQRGALICCGNTQGEIETSNLMGILSYHMYSVTGTKEVQTLHGSVSLLRVRNPWGHTEWIGPWRDGGPEWQSVKDPEESENVILEDGEFWMAVDDFQKNFHFLEICHLGPQSIVKIGAAAKPWEYVTYEGRWVKGLSAGGSLTSSDYYWLNPQFSLTLENNNKDNSEPQTLCSFIVSVMQKHQRLRRTGHIRVACHIFQVKYFISTDWITLFRKLHIGGDDTHVYIFQDALRSFQPLLSAGPCDNHREVVLCSSLPPGRYIIIPSLEKESDEGEFLIRILTEKGCNNRPLEMNAKCAEIPALSPFPSEDHCMRRFLQFANQEGRVNSVQLHKLLAWLLTEFGESPFAKVHLGDLPLTNGLNGYIGCWIPGLGAVLHTLEENHSWNGRDLSITCSLIMLYNTRVWPLEASTDITMICFFLQCIFANLHKDKTDRISGDQLVAALQSAGLPADDFLVRLAQVRYGDPDGLLSYPDYICCLLKLQSLTEKFQAADPSGSGEVTLNYRQGKVKRNSKPVRSLAGAKTEKENCFTR